MILILTNFVKSKPHFPFDSRCPNRCEISHYRILQPDPINNLNPIPQKGRKVKSRGHKHNNGSHCRIFLHEFQCQPAVTGGLVIAENVRKKIRFFLLVFILKIFYSSLVSFCMEFPTLQLRKIYLKIEYQI